MKSGKKVAFIGLFLFGVLGLFLFLKSKSNLKVNVTSVNVHTVSGGANSVKLLSNKTKLVLKDKQASESILNTGNYVINLNNSVYLQQGFNFGQDIDNLQMELLTNFDDKKFVKYLYESYIVGDFSGVQTFIKKYYLLKGKKLKLSLKLLKIKVLPKGDYNVFVNDKKALFDKDEYIVKLKFPYVLNIRVERSGCVDYVKKVIGNTKKEITLNVGNCIKLKKISIDGGKITYDQYYFYSNGLNADKVEISYLDSKTAQDLGYLNLPILSNYTNKLIGQSFDSYGMPIIKFYKNGKLINTCVNLYIKTSGELKNIIKESSIPENRYLSAQEWEKNGLPGWWNLDTKSMTWHPGKMEIYNKSAGLLLAKYCYKF